MNTIELNNGIKIPQTGFGTWQLIQNVESTIATALEFGYRHFDTADVYTNERRIGIALRDSGIPREELFITTKVWTDFRGYEKAKMAIESSLIRLKVDYIDLMLIHWPADRHKFADWKELNAGTWKALEEYHENGKLKAIGLSNFMPEHIEALLETATVIPAANQIELHPGYLQPEAVSYCEQKGIAIQAWSPLGMGGLLQNELLSGLAAKYDTSVAAFCIQFLKQLGFVVLPKSATPANIDANLNYKTFTIDASDMETVKAMPEKGYGLNPRVSDVEI